MIRNLKLFLFTILLTLGIAIAWIPFALADDSTKVEETGKIITFGDLKNQIDAVNAELDAFFAKIGGRGALSSDHSNSIEYSRLVDKLDVLKTFLLQKFEHCMMNYSILKNE